MKCFVNDEIVLEDSNDKNPKVEGPIWLGSSVNSVQSALGLNLTFPFQKELGLSEFYNPYKMCEILNESVIALIGDFQNIEEIKLVAVAMTFQQNKSFPTDSNNFQFSVKFFSNNQEFENYLTNPLYKSSSDISNSIPGICIGIEGSYNNDSHIFYTTFRFSDDFYWKNYFFQSSLHLKPSTTISTNNLDNLIQGNLMYTKLTQGGFLYFQNLLYDGLVALKAGVNIRPYTQIYTVKLHNTQKLSEFTFLKKIKSFFQIIIGMSFCCIIFRTTFVMGEEKYFKIIGLMHIKGMERIYYYLSWIIEYIIISALLSLLCSFQTKFWLFINTNLFLILFFYFIHSFNQFCFSFVFGSLLNSATISLVVGSSIHFMTMSIGIIINTYEFAFPTIEWLSIFPPIGGISLISLLIDCEV